MSAICIIPAKGTSTRIPGKNIRDFMGKPIIAYSIETALKSCLFDEVVVSSDSDEVLDVAKQFYARTLKRTQGLAEENGAVDCGTNEVVRDALKRYKYGADRQFDYACCLYPCAPMVTITDLGEAMHALKIPTCSFALGVNRGHDAGQFYLGYSWAFLTRLSLTTEHSIGIEMKARAIDVNTEADWLALEKKWKELHP